MEHSVFYWPEFDELCLVRPDPYEPHKRYLILFYDNDNDIRDAIQVHPKFFYENFIEIGEL